MALGQHLDLTHSFELLGPLHDSLGYKGGMHHMHLFSEFQTVWFFDPLRSGEEWFEEVRRMRIKCPLKASAKTAILVFGKVACCNCCYSVIIKKLS